MNSSSLKKILPVFDTALVLIVILFCTAGLKRAGGENLPFIAGIQKLLDEIDQLKANLLEKEKQFHDLQQQLQQARAFEDSLTNGMTLQGLQDSLQGTGERMAQLGGSLQELSQRSQEIHKQMQRRYEAEKTLAVLKAALERLEAQAAELLPQKEELAQRVSEQELEASKRRQLSDAYETLQKQIVAVRERLRKLQSEQKQAAQRQLVFGDYTGPFVLLECGGDNVTAPLYERTFPSEPSEAQADWLREQVEKKGFVVMVIRPGAFAETFDQYYNLLSKYIMERKEKGIQIGISFFPLEENEPIDAYLLKGEVK